MRRWIAALLTAAVAICAVGCARASQAPEGVTLAVYYAAAPEDVPGGDILATAAVPWAEQAMLSPQKQAEAALKQLMGECRVPGFSSCTVSGSTAVVDFSAAYGQLSGMKLTIADYCVTLTLTQIEPIRLVRILVNGQELAYRSSSTLLAGDALLSSTEDVVRSFAATLYFRNADGELTGEDRLLTLYEGESRGAVVLNALLSSPENSELETVLPPEFAVLSFRTEDGLCLMNLPGSDEGLLPEDPAGQAQMLNSIVRSLCSLDGVNAVQVLVDGEMRGNLGAVDISQPLTDGQ